SRGLAGSLPATYSGLARGCRLRTANRCANRESPARPSPACLFGSAEWSWGDWASLPIQRAWVWRGPLCCPGMRRARLHSIRPGRRRLLRRDIQRWAFARSWIRLLVVIPDQRRSRFYASDHGGILAMKQYDDGIP